MALKELLNEVEVNDRNATPYYGRRMSGDGVVAVASLPSSASSLMNGDFTILMEVQRDAVNGTENFFGSQNANLNDSIIIQYQNVSGNVRFSLQANGGSTVNIDFIDVPETYVRMAFVVDNTAKTVRLWYNGAWHATTGSFAFDTSQMNISQDLMLFTYRTSSGSLASRLSGMMGNVQIYSSALSQSNLEAIDASGGAALNSVACWITGADQNSAVAPARWFDHSGNGHHAVNTGLTSSVSNAKGLQIARMGHTFYDPVPGFAGESALILARPDETTDWTTGTVVRPYVSSMGGLNCYAPANNEGYAEHSGIPSPLQGDYTFGAWVRLNVNPGSTFQNIFFGTSNDYAWLRIHGNNMRWKVGSKIEENWSKAFTVGKWYLVGYKRGQFFARAEDEGAWDTHTISDSVTDSVDFNLLGANRSPNPNGACDIYHASHFHASRIMSEADLTTYYDATKP